MFSALAARQVCGHGEVKDFHDTRPRAGLAGREERTQPFRNTERM